MKKFIQVGTGGFGAYWCETVIPRVASFAQPVAAVDINPDALLNATKFLHLPDERCYTDLETALREVEADFVNVVVPPQLHESIIDAAIAHGLDIISEKPLGGDMDACIRILQKVRASDRKLAVTMSHRLEVEKQTVQRMALSGEYGKLNYIVSRLTMPRRLENEREMLSSRDKVTSMINNGLVHNLDTMRAVSGSNAKSVYVSGYDTQGDALGRGTCVFAILEMENGVRAQLEMSSANAHGMDGWSDEYLRAECDLGTIIADHRKITVYNDLGFPYPCEATIPLLRQDYWDHALVIRQFVDWLGDGKAPVTNIEENINCCALVYAAIESVMTGKVIDVRQYLAAHMKKYE